MNRRIDCEQLRDVAPELALGLLTGRERAAFLAHLEGCGACRAEVSGLAVTADDVLLAGPRSTPPEGFDRRVLDRLTSAGAFQTPATESPAADHGPLGESGAGADRPVPDGVVPVNPPIRHRHPHPDRDRHPDRHRRPGEPAHATPGQGRPGQGRSRRGRRVLAGAAVVIAAVAAAVGGVAGLGGLGHLTDGGGPAPAAVATAEMRTGNGRLVGDATVRGDDPAVVTVDLPGWSELVRLYGDGDGSGPYWLTVELDDGARTTNRIPPDDTAWEVPLRAGAGEVAAVSVVDAEGRTWCTGRFPA